MSIQNTNNDQVDRKIAMALMNDATVTSIRLGKVVGLSSSAANERIRKLKSNGSVKKIVALVDSKFMDMALGAFIFVLVEGKENNEVFLERILSHENILECHHITGEYSYILKVRYANTKSLEFFITDFLKGQSGVTKTMTQIILSSHKEKSFIVE
jgi:Lrp/AsnC family leucine-responsive transcriptional regulator